MIPFGSTLQSWATQNDEASKKKASVWLTLEQSQWHANDVDLCWHVNAKDEKDNTVAAHKYCTTWLAKMTGTRTSSDPVASAAMVPKAEP